MPCRCGNLDVDGRENYIRIIGVQRDFELVKGLDFYSEKCL